MKKLILGTAIIFASSSCKSEVKKEKTSQDLEVEIIKKEETRSLFIQLNEKNKSKETFKKNEKVKVKLRKWDKYFNGKIKKCRKNKNYDISLDQRDLFDFLS